MFLGWLVLLLGENGFVVSVVVLVGCLFVLMFV